MSFISNTYQAQAVTDDDSGIGCVPQMAFVMTLARATGINIWYVVLISIFNCEVCC